MTRQEQRFWYSMLAAMFWVKNTYWNCPRLCVWVDTDPLFGICQLHFALFLVHVLFLLHPANTLPFTHKHQHVLLDSDWFNPTLWVLHELDGRVVLLDPSFSLLVSSQGGLWLALAAGYPVFQWLQLVDLVRETQPGAGDTFSRWVSVWDKRPVLKFPCEQTTDYDKYKVKTTCYIYNDNYLQHVYCVLCTTLPSCNL